MKQLASLPIAWIKIPSAIGIRKHTFYNYLTSNKKGGFRLKVKSSQLKEGCILSIGVNSLTSKPIIPKKTILNEELIKVLNAFLVKEVNVEPTLVNGEPFQPEEVIEDDEDNVVDSQSFFGHYLRSVRQYKNLFKSWQAGSPIEVGKVRSILLPLLTRAVEKPYDIFTLHHYSNKEDYLFHHGVTVGLLSGFIGKKLDYEQGDWIQIALAGFLSDCGMSKVDPKIIAQKSSLTSSQYNEIKQHPAHSYKMLQKISVLKEGGKLGVIQHHERNDGSGYPFGSTEEKLHPFGKIIAVADVYHAMNSERPYRMKQSSFKVLENIIQDNFGKFDIKVVQALTSGLANFSIGTKVKLSNGNSGEIVFIDSSTPTRPMIKLVNSKEIVNLSNNKEIFIEEILT